MRFSDISRYTQYLEIFDYGVRFPDEVKEARRCRQLALHRPQRLRRAPSAAAAGAAADGAAVSVIVGSCCVAIDSLRGFVDRNILRCRGGLGRWSVALEVTFGGRHQGQILYFSHSVFKNAAIIEAQWYKITWQWKKNISKEFMHFSQSDNNLCCVDWLIPLDCLPTNKKINSSVLVYWEPYVSMTMSYENSSPEHKNLLTELLSSASGLTEKGLNLVVVYEHE